MSDWRMRIIVATGLLSGSLSGSAEVVFDGTTGGPAGLLSGDITITESDGLVTQGNDALLHSFELFNVLAGESVTFSHLTPTINNILLRVTGAQTSMLDGQLTSDANLWLLNPNGVLLGNQRSLDISGSFRANSVNGEGAALILNDGTTFAVDTNLNTLAVARPADFGFVTDVAELVVADASLGTVASSTPRADGQLFSISGGRVAGSNLFHSFEQFSVFEGDTVEFTAPAGTSVPIANLISRVTGNEKTFITGTVRASGPELAGASFWLVNPTGMFVGNNVQLDVARGLHLGVADGVNGRDEEEQEVSFSSQFSNADLFVGNPSGFSVFDFENLGDLKINNLAFSQRGRLGNSVTDDVIFFGRNVEISNSMLQLEAAIDGAGRFSVTAAGGVVRLEKSMVRATAINGANVSGVSLSGARLFANGTSIELINTEGNTSSPSEGIFGGFFESVSLVDTLLSATTSGVGSSGSIIFNTPRFVMEGGMTVVRSTGLGSTNGVLVFAFDNGTGLENEREIRLEGGAQIRIDNLNSLSQIDDPSLAASQISLFTDGDVILNGSVDDPIRLDTDAGPQTNALGAVFINAGNNVTVNQLLLSADSRGTLPLPASRVGRDDPRAVFVQGASGLDIKNSRFSISTSGAIDAGELFLSGAGIRLDRVTLESSTSGEGDAGAIIIGSSSTQVAEPTSGSFLPPETIPATETLSIGNSSISANTETTGDGGGVFLTSANTISLDQVAIQVSSLASDLGGAAGEIRVLGKNEVEVTNGSQIRATTKSGTPGIIRIAGMDIALTNSLLETDSSSAINRDSNIFGISISTDLSVFAQEFPSAELVAGTSGPIELTDTVLSGRVTGAGNSSGILLEGFQIQLDNTDVSASTSGFGNAGNIVFRNGREISLSNNSSVANSSTGSGAAGLISFTARLENGPLARAELVSPDSPEAGLGRIDIVDSQITSNTLDGGAGQLGIVADRVRITGPETRLSTNSSGNAEAGDILLFGSAVSVDGGARVQSTASGSGDSNAVRIGAFDLTIGDRESGHRTSVSTNSLGSRGGDVVVLSSGLAQIVNADLVASAGDDGSGGNVRLNVEGGELLVASSTLLAQAENGDGGVIDIDPTPDAQIFIDGQSVLNADSATGTSGSVVVDSPDTGIVSALSQQEAALAPEARLEQDACNAATRATSASSLYVREAVVRDPFTTGYVGVTGWAQSAQGDCP